MAATLVSYLLAGYVLAGLIFASAFVVSGVQRVDQLAISAGMGFRILLLPGSVALWPLLLARWISVARRRM
jgi:hypothetical protein